MLVVEVKVVPKSSKRRVELIDKHKLKVWVHSAPEKGQANDEVRELLSEYFGIPRSRVRLIKGEHTRIKTFELDTGRDKHNIKGSLKEV